MNTEEKAVSHDTYHIDIRKGQLIHHRHMKAATSNMVIKNPVKI